MSTNFPTSLDTFVNPTGTDLLENANNALDHDVQHSNANDAIEALEAKVGIDGSADQDSLDYKLSGISSGDVAVSESGTQTLTNKTLTSPKITAGVMQKGDMFQLSNADGTLTYLRASSNGQIPVWNSSTSQWEAQANPAASDASTTVKGVVEIADTSEITAGTSTGGTGAVLVVPASAVGAAGAYKIVQYDSSGKLPAVDGSNLTNIPGSKLAISLTPVTVTTTLTETTIATIAVPANTLGTANAIKGRLIVSTMQLDASSSTALIIRMKYGSTTVCTYNIADAASSTGAKSGFIDFNLMANASTSAQTGNIGVTFGDSSDDTFHTIAGLTTGTATEDSTGALNLVITVQFANNTSGNNITMASYIAEKVY